MAAPRIKIFHNTMESIAKKLILSGNFTIISMQFLGKYLTEGITHF